MNIKIDRSRCITLRGSFLPSSFSKMIKSFTMKYNYCNKGQEQEQGQVVFANQGLGIGDFGFTLELLSLKFKTEASA